MIHEDATLLAIRLASAVKPDSDAFDLAHLIGVSGGRGFAGEPRVVAGSLPVEPNAQLLAQLTESILGQLPLSLAELGRTF